MDTISVNILNELAAVVEKPEEKIGLVERLFDKAAFSWSEFLFLGATLVAIYFLLQLLKWFLQVTQWFGNYRRIIQTSIKSVLLVFEPIVVLLLSSAFIMLNPIYHGSVLGLVVLFGFTHIRNYVHGRVIQTNSNLAIGREIQIGKLEGIINTIERLGLKIKTAKGLHYMSFAHIIEAGYVLLSGDDISGYYQLKIIPKEPNSKINYEWELMDALSVVPYLDWNHKPEISIEDDNHIIARVVVKDESHIYELMDLINEWNYSCKILK
ncbi:MAG: hypothetical protein ACI97N_000755 [Cognaticolwellia sp.]|jgi:hypothetical protein